MSWTRGFIGDQYNPVRSQYKEVVLFFMFIYVLERHGNS
jgi:hypothetical protein